MHQKILILFTLIFTSLSAQVDYETLAQDFLYAVRVADDYQELEKQLAAVEVDVLVASLNSENKKKAFWLNIYNAYIQLKAKENQSMIEESKHSFFTKSWIVIAGKTLSFDNIEHGFLRHSQWKYGMGYIPYLFTNSYERQLRVDELDFRIHFALNCGAKGCPPIAFYSAEKLDHQLDIAMGGFLETNTNYNIETNEVEVSKILSWFKGDFGGSNGILALLESQQLIPAGSKAKLLFSKYDWTLSLSNYVD
jgi:hypothetical protein